MASHVSFRAQYKRVAGLTNRAGERIQDITCSSDLILARANALSCECEPVEPKRKNRCLLLHVPKDSPLAVFFSWSPLS